MSRSATKQLIRWLNELGKVTDEPGKLTRTFLSPAMRRANALVGKWMRESGLVVREDAFGNLIGRLEAKVGSPLAGASGARASLPASGGAEGDQGSRPTNSIQKTLLLGSHLDTVRDAGKYDGALGVLLPIAALAELRRRGVALPFAVEVIGFSEEEGVRFSSAYLGSKGYAGGLRAADMKLRDADGVSVREAMAAWRRQMVGGALARHTLRGELTTYRDLIGYVEVHIEQGPVLEQGRLAVGLVSAIAGQTRGQIIFRGRAGHAGTTPMKLRRDALAGAAEYVSFVESLARASPGLVATVGAMKVSPGAPNVIPGEVSLSLDVRHARNDSRRAALKLLLAGAKSIARRRRLSWKWEKTQDNNAVQCAPTLTTLLGESVRAVQRRSLALVSGAGHDAVVMSSIAPVAMLFVRCRDGLSHHPDEFASPNDIGVALEVMIDFIERLAKQAATV